MQGIPQKLLEQATRLGFECITEGQQHLIRPTTAKDVSPGRIGSAGWYLVYRKGHWVLVVNNTPQMHFSYDEVLTFLDRFTGEMPEARAQSQASML